MSDLTECHLLAFQCHSIANYFMDFHWIEQISSRQIEISVDGNHEPVRIAMSQEASLFTKFEDDIEETSESSSESYDEIPECRLEISKGNEVQIALHSHGQGKRIILNHESIKCRFMPARFLKSRLKLWNSIYRTSKDNIIIDALRLINDRVRIAA